MSVSLEEHEITKSCSKCGENKPVAQFSKCLSNKDGYQSSCKLCMKEAKKRVNDNTRSDALAGLSRIDQFLQSKRPPRELTDDEIFGRYILDDNKRPIQINMFERTKSFQNAWGKEISFRLNQYLITKTPRAFEVMFQIMDSDLVEPADRIKAAQFIIERTMGKTPDVVLTGGMGDKPYQGILDSIESGSREDFRKGIESTRLEIEPPDQRNGIHSDDRQILDAEVDDDFISDERHGSPDGSETTGLGNNGSSGIRGPEQSVSSAGEYADSSETGDGRDSDTGTDESAFRRVQEQKNLRQRAKEMAQERAKQKQRRFAARAVGATSLSGLPFLIEWKIITNFNSPDFGSFYMNLIHPKDINEKVLQRVERSNDPTRQADALEASARKACAKITS